MNKKKLLGKLLAGSKNIRFDEARKCAESLGFKVDRITGSHHILVHADIPDLINLQNVGGKVKRYQVNQLLKLIERHNLKIEDQ